MYKLNVNQQSNPDPAPQSKKKVLARIPIQASQNIDDS